MTASDNPVWTKKGNLLAIMERQMDIYYKEASHYAISAIDTDDEQKVQYLKEKAQLELARYNTMKLARDMVLANIE